MVQSFDFLAYWWFCVITYYKRWKKQKQNNTSILRGISKSNQAIFVCQPQSWFILSILPPYVAWASVTPNKRILYCSNFKYFLFLSFSLNPWTLQILRYIWHIHVFVSQKFIYNKIGIRRNRIQHRPNKMIRQSVHTLFRPAGGPSHCPSVNSFIHPSIQTSEQLIKNLGQNP